MAINVAPDVGTARLRDGLSERIFRNVVPEIGRELRTKGYGFIPFDPPLGLITRVMEGWNAFLTLPFEKRLEFRVGNPLDWDDGYVPRQKEGTIEGGYYDNKNFFHYKPHLYALLDHRGTDYKDRLEWLLDLHQLWAFCHSCFKSVVYNLDQHLPGHDFLERLESPVAKSRHVLRLLSYNEKMKPGQELGKKHIDRNFGTIQVFETHPALLLHLPEKTEIYAPRPRQALVFSSGKAEKLTEGKLKGVPHSIVVPDGHVSCDRDIRQSIVFFAHIFPDSL